MAIIKERIKLIEYFKSTLNHNRILFLNERHSSIKNKNINQNKQIIFAGDPIVVN